MDSLQAGRSDLVVEQAQRPAGADRTELAVIPDGAHHRPVAGCHVHELGQLRGGHHAHLIEDQHVPSVQLRRPSAPGAVSDQEGVNGRRLRANVLRHDSSRGRRGGQANDVAAGRTDRIRSQGQARSLAGPGRTDPQAEQLLISGKGPREGHLTLTQRARVGGQNLVKGLGGHSRDDGALGSGEHLILGLQDLAGGVNVGVGAHELAGAISAGELRQVRHIGGRGDGQAVRAGGFAHHLSHQLIGHRAPDHGLF